MQDDIYVDNLVSETNTEEEASTYLTQSRSIMTPVHFNLRSWNSNSSKVRTLAAEQGINDVDTETKVLGLLWNTDDDLLKFQERQSNTERNSDPRTVGTRL